MSNSSSELLFLSLKDFYSKKDNINKLLSIIHGPSKISLRLIDWFITNYCKNYCEKDASENNLKSIYQEYRSQLKAYKKIKFDPFRRRQRIVFYYNTNDSINTTIGQLNFFKWAIEIKVVDYIVSNYNDLECIMNEFQKTIKKEKKDYKTKWSLDQEVDDDSMAASLTNDKSLVYFD